MIADNGSDIRERIRTIREEERIARLCSTCLKLDRAQVRHYGLETDSCKDCGANVGEALERIHPVAS